MQQHKNNKFTYADYAQWQGPDRYELIEGMPYLMSPAPSTSHQRISRKLLTRIDTYLEGKSCEVFDAPFDVRLNADLEDDTIVQPDLAIICDPHKIDERGCHGVPDLIIEILSPSTANHDQITKFNLYRNAGVREYWIVDPDNRNVRTHLLQNGEYLTRAYADTDTAPVTILDDLQINLAEVFPPLPETAPAPSGPTPSNQA